MRLRLLIPAALKDKLQWDVEVYLHPPGALKVLVYSTGNAAQLNNAAAYIEGVAPPDITHHSSDLTVVTTQAQMSMYPSGSAVFNLYDDVTDGQLLINEFFWVR